MSRRATVRLQHVVDAHVLLIDPGRVLLTLRQGTGTPMANGGSPAVTSKTRNTRPSARPAKPPRRSASSLTRLASPSPDSSITALQRMRRPWPGVVLHHRPLNRHPDQRRAHNAAASTGSHSTRFLRTQFLPRPPQSPASPPAASTRVSAGMRNRRDTMPPKPRRARPAGLSHSSTRPPANDAYMLTPNDGQHPARRSAARHGGRRRSGQSVRSRTRARRVTRSTTAAPLKVRDGGGGSSPRVPHASRPARPARTAETSAAGAVPS